MNTLLFIRIGPMLITVSAVFDSLTPERDVSRHARQLATNLGGVLQRWEYA